MTTNRARWAAVGAAVAVTAGAGGIGFVQADSAPSSTSFVPNVPCRMLDTRLADPVDKVGAGETISLDVRGVIGDCEIPAGARGLSVNIAAVGASSDTFLTAFPSGSERPTSSHLNVRAAVTTSNGVDVSLSADGGLDIYNDAGELHVIVDVLGAYVPVGSSGKAGPAGPSGPVGKSGADGENGEDGIDGASAFTVEQLEIELLPRGVDGAAPDAEAMLPDGPIGQFGYFGPLDVCDGGIIDARFVEPTIGEILVVDLDQFGDTDGAPLLGGPYPGTLPSLFGRHGIDVSVYFDAGIGELSTMSDGSDPVTTQIEVICVAAPVAGIEFDGEPDNDVSNDLFAGGL